MRRLLCLSCLLSWACGTPPPVDDDAGSGGSGAGAEDGGSDAAVDAGSDAGVDAGGVSDAGVDAGGGADAGYPDGGATYFTPFTDAVAGESYKGFPIGLYPVTGNAIPPLHRQAGLQRANQVQPLDLAGNPAVNGNYILLSIGYSNATQEFCAQNGSQQCDPWTFMGQLAQDPEVRKAGLVVFNGASGGQTNATWDQPTDMNYDRLANNLADAGYSERQVQVAWVKIANISPAVALPAANADAWQLASSSAAIARSLKVRYPNIKLVFFSSRTYGGWATTQLNPEPYAYEGALAVRWTIEAQLRQMADGGVSADAGDLDYNTVAPWIGWGPYLWTDGLRGRGDALTWQRNDTEGDGTHPSTSGERKVGTMLLGFFKGSPLTRCWFTVDGGSCP
jgi:hypothetical protein